MMNTCDKCKHYEPSEWSNDHAYAFTGKCNLIEDTNDRYDQPFIVGIDRVASWDGSSYYSGAYVGPKFGCIHWEAK